MHVCGHGIKKHMVHIICAAPFVDNREPALYLCVSASFYIAYFFLQFGIFVIQEYQEKKSVKSSEPPLLQVSCKSYRASITRLKQIHLCGI